MSRRVVVLAVVAGALAVLAVIGAPGPPPPPIALRLPAWSTVERVELTRTGDAAVRLERAGEGWRVEGAAVDPQAVATLAEVLASPVGMDKAEVVPDDALDRYGLTADALTVTLATAEGTQRFRVGKVVDGRRTFIRPADGDTVYRARANLRRALDRPAAAWRDRRVFPDVAGADLARLALTRGPREDWAAARAAGATWRLTSGEPAEADAIDTLAHALASLQAGDALPPDHPLTPLVTLTGQTFDGRSIGLALGPKRPDGGRDARRLGDGATFSLPAHVAAFLDVGAAALTDPRLFPVAPDEVLGIAFGGESPRRIARRGAGWALEAPHVVEALPPAAIDPIVQGVLGARAAGVAERVPEDAFAGHLETVQLHLKGDRQLALTIGGAFRAGARFARLGPDRTVVLAAPTVAALTPGLAALTGEP